MFTSSINRTKNILLLRKQCEQWRLLYATEIETRISLAARHKMQEREFIENHTKLINQQNIELLEFRISNQERRAILVDQHFREFRENN